MRIDKIDPPSWFVGMTDSILQLFVYGEGLNGIDVSTSMGETKRIISGNLYAVVKILLYIDCKDGVHDIIFRKDGVEIVEHYTLQTKIRIGHSQITPADSIYLIMPDRFAKGKETKVRKDLKPKDPNGWHGGNINGIREHLDYIENLGITTIWLTPVFKNNKSAYKGKFYSYHGYAITDFYDVDEHFGTIEDYRLFVREAHVRGLKVVMDVVFNHCGSEHPWNNGASPRSWINVNHRKSNYECTTIFGSYVSRYDKEQTVKGWFADTMPDLNLKNEDVLRYLTQVTFWWIETTGIDAIRMDTYLYSDNRQMNKWLKILSKEYPYFSVISETWVGNSAYTSKVQQSAVSATGKDNPLIVMDFAFQEKLSEAIDKGDLKIIYDHFIYDFLYADAHQVLAFLDNHDMMRWARMHNNVADTKIALTILLTMPRIPQIFYGTEFMFRGDGNGKDDGKLRQDFLIESDNRPLTADRNDFEKEMFEYMRKLLFWRQNSSAIKSGNMIHFLPQGGTYVYFRVSRDEKLMVIANPTEKSQNILLGRFLEMLWHSRVGLNVLDGKQIKLDAYTTNGNSIIEIKKKEVLILKLL